MPGEILLLIKNNQTQQQQKANPKKPSQKSPSVLCDKNYLSKNQLQTLFQKATAVCVGDKR